METTHWDLIVIGAGHAGGELAVAARQAGWAGSILLIGDEPVIPYQRPPLSKGYLAGEQGLEAIALRPEAAYERAQVMRWAGVAVARIDRMAHEVVLAGSGRRLRYGKLAICTGGRPRRYHCEGMAHDRPPANLLYLRTLADAVRLRQYLRPGCRLAVIGGGYIGLEVAASAVQAGTQVTVLEAQERVLARVAGPQLSAFYEAEHRRHGVTVVTGARIARARVRAGDNVITALQCEDGTVLEVDVVVAGIGMQPNVGLAQDAQLCGPDGIVVDVHGRTVDPDIYAAGDCTLHEALPYGRHLRIESVPNALEQARAVAAHLCGKARPYAAVPWFWSDQYDLKLQMAGLSPGHDQCVVRGDPATRSFCAFYLAGTRLLAVDAVNRPAEFMLARRALAWPQEVDARRLADESLPLKELLSIPA
jgi:3-phenylpropionate/trans-cinnamate dioxygenase ferredoxin reductase subunit